jgi:hypothetical protein
MKNPLIISATIFGLTSCEQVPSKESNPTHRDTLQEVQLTFTKTVQKQPLVLFVQWQYPSTITAMQVLDMRQRVEQKINYALKMANAGSWFAGDLGSGGANMLFEIRNKETAILIIQNILKKEAIEKESVIAERIYLGPNDWTHKVIIPKNFKGEFNDM